MFVVEVGSAAHHRPVRSAIASRRVTGAAPLLVHRLRSPLWLWFTVLFANFAEAVAEGRGKAQADALRKMRKDIDGAASWSMGRRSGCRPPRCARATWWSSRPGS